MIVDRDILTQRGSSLASSNGDGLRDGQSGQEDGCNEGGEEHDAQQ